MEYHLNASDFVSTPAPMLGWRRLQLPDAVGDCFTDQRVLADGLAVVYSHYRPQRDLREASAVDRPTRALTLTIALEGQSSTLDADGQRFDFVAGHSTLAAFASVRGQRRFPAGRTIRQLRLIAEESVLQRYGLAVLLDDAAPGQPARRLCTARYGGAVQQMAERLVHLHDCEAGALDLQIAALSLLAEQTRPLLPSSQTQGPLRTADQQRVLQARDLLMRQYDQPLTVAYLCAAVGTNECTLKQGFRTLFGTSPHRMLTAIRMQKAWELLESGLHVASVAYCVGYRHPSSFSTAFERYHGRTPKSVAGTRRRQPTLCAP